MRIALAVDLMIGTVPAVAHASARWVFDCVREGETSVLVEPPETAKIVIQHGQPVSLPHDAPKGVVNGYARVGGHTWYVQFDEYANTLWLDRAICDFKGTVPY